MDRTPPVLRGQTESVVRVVYKYPLDPATGGQHAIPSGSRFLALQVQGETPTMWWSIPADAGDQKDWPLRTFTVAPTGPPGYVDDTLNYVGTFQLRGGAFVGHVFAWEDLDA